MSGCSASSASSFPAHPPDPLTEDPVPLQQQFLEAGRQPRRPDGGPSGVHDDAWMVSKKSSASAA
jgi:hypothetical protein